MMIVDTARCETCGACAGVCPAEAIAVLRNGITIDHERCRRCRACESVCPVGAIAFSPEQ